MVTVIIKKEHGEITVNAPFNTDFVTGAKDLSGYWRSPDWVFDARNEKMVRELCLYVYGTDGDSFPRVVTVRATFGPGNNTRTGPILIFGKTVARAWGRDTGIKLGEGVVLLKGGFRSGGSVKNWETQAENGTVALVHDIPQHRAEKAIKEGAKWLTIEPETPDAVDPDALKAEQIWLIKRLARVNELLAQRK